MRYSGYDYIDRGIKDKKPLDDIPVDKLCINCKDKSDKSYCRIGINMKNNKKICRYHKEIIDNAQTK